MSSSQRASRKEEEALGKREYSFVPDSPRELSSSWANPLPDPVCSWDMAEIARAQSLPEIRLPRLVVSRGLPSASRTSVSRRPAQPVASCWDRLVLTPERGSRAERLLTAWETWTTLLLLASAYLLPFSAALPTLCHDLEPVFDLMDACFTIDLLRNFFVAYHLPTESKANTIWERGLGKIALRYCSVPFSSHGEAGWFWLDVMPLLPVWLRCFLDESILEAARFTRLLRLTRLTLVGEKMQMYQATSGLPYIVSDTIKFILITTLVSHTAACLWVMIEGTVTSSPFGRHTGESWLSALISAKGDCCNPDAEHDPLCVYNLALYWAMMTLTSVGYGDITPQTALEYTISTLLMFLAGFMWAYIVGSVVSLLSQLDPDHVRFKQNFDKLNAFMDRNSFSPELRSKLREYMVVAKNVDRARHENMFLQRNVSSGLQRQVAMQTPFLKTIVRQVYWARCLERDALLEIMRSLEGAVYSANETIPIRGRMIIVREGLLAVRGGRILARNSVYGENSILLTNEGLQDDVMPRTLCCSTVLALTKQSLMQTCEHFPCADKALRRAQIRTAVWRAFVLAARRRRSTLRRHSRAARRTGFAESLSKSKNKQINGAATRQALLEFQTSVEEGHRDFMDQMQDVREQLQDEFEALEELRIAYASSPTRFRYFADMVDRVKTARSAVRSSVRF